MVVDTSAVMAILLEEPEQEAFLAAIGADSTRLISAATMLELSIVAGSSRREAGVQDVELFLYKANVKQVEFGGGQVMHAIKAFQRYGKGRHPAKLNLGDCFSYALAKISGEPLLYKGNDFAKTDIPPAVPLAA